MTFRGQDAARLRDALALPADADAGSVLTAISDALDAQTELYEHVPAGREPAAAVAVPAGHVVVPARQVAELEQQLKGSREGILSAYAAKMMPENRALWAAQYDRDPTGTIAYLEAAPVLNPAAHPVDAEPEQGDAEVYDALFERLFGASA